MTLRCATWIIWRRMFVSLSATTDACFLSRMMILCVRSEIVSSLTILAFTVTNYSRIKYRRILMCQEFFRSTGPGFLLTSMHAIFEPVIFLGFSLRQFEALNRRARSSCHPPLQGGEGHPLAALVEIDPRTLGCHRGPPPPPPPH